MIVSRRRRSIPSLAIVVALLIGLTLIAAWRAVTAAEGSRHAAGAPNVVLIVADDMRADGVAVMPALNRLAARGVVFSQAFATTPLCCPSRASILTGRYARNHGVLTNEAPDGGFERFDDRSTLATWLRAAGVRTGLIGRYLNGYRSTYVAPGWDSWFAIWQSGGKHPQYYNYAVTEDGSQRSFGDAPDDYSMTVLTRQALRFLEAERERPFMLMLAARPPHYPATPAPGDAATFANVDLELPPSFDEADVADKPRRIRDEPRLAGEELADILRTRRRQLASLQSLDRAIDDLVAALNADGRLANTWLIFTSDNGVALGEHRIRGKSCAYEECARVPLIVVPPGGLAESKVLSELVANIDLAPTIAAIAGATPDAGVDGRSLLPLIAGQPTAWREGIVLESWPDEEAGEAFTAVRTADRKYVRYSGGEDELYDLRADPYELENQSHDPGRAAERAALAERLDALLRSGSGPGGPPAP